MKLINHTSSLLGVLALVNVVNGRTNASAESDGCSVLRSHFIDDVFDPNSTVYNYENHQFWSLTEVLSPSCVYRPTSAVRLATGLEILEEAQAEFAIRGGGHMANQGFNDINDGVLIVMSNLSTLVLSEDQSVLSVGPAYRWKQVYSFLEPHSLAVAGGRVAPVGVPGLLLAGGINFYGNAQGWSCDNVINYEVVLANGSIIYANQTSHSDLFWALKGGSSNFGIVSRFDLKTIESTKVWAGIYTVNGSYLDRFLDAVATYASDIYDPKSHIIPSILPGNQSNETLAAVTLFYNSDTVSFPDILKPFTDIPAISSTLDFKTLAQLAAEIGEGVIPDIRDIAVAGSFTGDSYSQLIQGISIVNQTFFDSVPTLFDQIPSANLTALEFAFQPVGTSWIEATLSKGGNALGLDPEKGTYICYASQIEWTGAQYDEIILSWLQETVGKVNQATKAVGLFDEFNYMGDAAGFQAIFPGYGEENNARLHKVAKEYDPTGVFQRLLPGGFKIF